MNDLSVATQQYCCICRMKHDSSLCLHSNVVRCPGVFVVDYITTFFHSRSSILGGLSLELLSKSLKISLKVAMKLLMILIIRNSNSKKYDKSCCRFSPSICPRAATLVKNVSKSLVEKNVVANKKFFISDSLTYLWITFYF